MRICSIPECGRKHYGNGYCNRHYQQFRYFGKIPERTTKTPSIIIVENNFCKIKLYNIRCIETGETKFDTKYKKEIESFNLKWHLSGHGYAESDYYYNDKWQKITLHQLIIQLSGQIVQDGYEIDHKDGNKLNNLDNNLRICTHAQNEQNRGKLNNNTSGYICVTWYKQTKKWKSYININNEQLHLGYFDTKEDAARAYNVATIKCRGEFAQLNIIP